MDTSTLKGLVEAMKKAAESKGFDYMLDDDNTPFNALIFLHQIRKENFRLGDTGVSARNLNHWKQKGLLPLKRQGGWTNFSFLEYIWLKIIQSLREFGLSLDALEKVKDWVFRPVEDEQAEAFHNDPEFYEKKYEQHGVIFGFNNLAFAITAMLFFRKIMILIVDAEGRSAFISNDEYSNPEKPRIVLPLLPYIKDFIGNPKNLSKIRELRILNHKEQEVIEQLRAGRISQINIKMLNGEIKSIEVTEQVKVEAEARFMDIIMKQKYLDVNFSVHQGRMTNVTKTTKKLYD